MDFVYIKTEKDITDFSEKTNALHDGYIISALYANNGITKIKGGHQFTSELTKLTIRILVTSIWDTIERLSLKVC